MFCQDETQEISKSIFVDDIVADFSKNSFLIIAGSSWPEDELILRKFYEENQSNNIITYLDLDQILLGREINFFIYLIFINEFQYKYTSF